MTVRERLRLVFVEAFELGPAVDVERLRQRDHERWDSLGHMTLIAAIEDEFEVELSPDQLLRMSSFEIAVETLEQLGVSDGG